MIYTRSPHDKVEPIAYGDSVYVRNSVDGYVIRNSADHKFGIWKFRGYCVSHDTSKEVEVVHRLNADHIAEKHRLFQVKQREQQEKEFGKSIQRIKDSVIRQFDASSTSPIRIDSGHWPAVLMQRVIEEVIEECNKDSVLYEFKLKNPVDPEKGWDVRGIQFVIDLVRTSGTVNS